MMRWNNFPRSVVFAAVAGLGLVPVLLFAGRFLGQHRALSVYLVGVIMLYVGGMAPKWSQGIRIAFLAGVLGTAVAILASTVTELAAGGALVLAICRSVFLYRSEPGRALLIETGVGGVSLLVAYYLAGPSLLALGLALWAFLLVQSVFFLIGGVKKRDPEADGRDPFDVARARAIELVERI
ncbi:MAG: hypothetical protein V3T05_10895 [Myxococcota bacterium]